MAGGAFGVRGKGRSESKGGPKGSEHGLDKLGLMGSRVGRWGFKAYGEQGLGWTGLGLWGDWGINEGLGIMGIPLLTISSSIQRRTQVRSRGTDPGDASVNRAKQADARFLLAGKVAHEQSQGLLVSSVGPKIGSQISNRVVNGRFRTVRTTHELSHGDVAFGPGHPDGAWPFGFDSFVESLPQVTITVKLHRPVMMSRIDDLVGGGGCVVTVSGDVNGMWGCGTGEQPSNLAASAGGERLVQNASNGHAIRPMNRPHVRHMSKGLLAMADRESASVRIPDAITSCAEGLQVGREAAIGPRIGLLWRLLGARSNREEGWWFSVANMLVDKSDGGDAMELVLVLEKGKGVAIEDIVASKKTMASLANALAFDGLNQGVLFHSTKVRGKSKEDVRGGVFEVEVM